MNSCWTAHSWQKKLYYFRNILSTLIIADYRNENEVCNKSKYEIAAEHFEVVFFVSRVQSNKCSIMCTMFIGQWLDKLVIYLCTILTVSHSIIKPANPCITHNDGNNVVVEWFTPQTCTQVQVATKSQVSQYTYICACMRTVFSVMVKAMHGVMQTQHLHVR